MEKLSMPGVEDPAKVNTESHVDVDCRKVAEERLAGGDLGQTSRNFLETPDGVDKSMAFLNS